MKNPTQVKKVIRDEVRGKVWVESEEGKGSTFFVELPINSQKKIDIKEYIKEKASA